MEKIKEEREFTANRQLAAESMEYAATCIMTLARESSLAVKQPKTIQELGLRP